MRLRGTNWQARLAQEALNHQTGSHRVIQFDGIKLVIEPIDHIKTS